MHFARGGHAVSAANGKRFAIGGNTASGEVAAAEAFDPTSNSWTVVPSLPTPRNHVSGFVVGGTVCVAGGRYPTTARVDCLDVAHSTWSRLPDLPRATSGGGAVQFLGGSAHLLAGHDATQTSI